jgi:hypothetical protein
MSQEQYSGNYINQMNQERFSGCVRLRSGRIGGVKAKVKRQKLKVGGWGLMVFSPERNAWG